MTVPVKRDVNPMINAMLILEDLRETEVLEVRIKDFGVFKESYAMGMLGPQIVASTTVTVNQEVDGYLELRPMKWLSLNGPPVIRMKVRWARIGEGGFPTPGATSALVDAWQAMRQPTAPFKEDLCVDTDGLLSLGPCSGVPAQLSDNTDETTPCVPAARVSGLLAAAAAAGPGVPAAGAPAAASGSDNPAAASGSGVQAAASGSGVPAAVGGSGVPAAGGSSASTSRPTSTPTSMPSVVFTNSSSVFYIDPAVYTWAKPNDALRTLHGMQQRGGSVYPFPHTPGCNYNCLAAGFDTYLGEHMSLWGPVADADLPRGLQEVHTAMEAFAVKGQENPHWCAGVLVCLSWLKAIQDPTLQW